MHRSRLSLVLRIGRRGLVLGYVEVRLGPGDFVLDGDHAPPPQKGDRCPHLTRLAYSNSIVDLGFDPGKFVQINI